MRLEAGGIDDIACTEQRGVVDGVGREFEHHDMIAFPSKCVVALKVPAIEFRVALRGAVTAFAEVDDSVSGFLVAANWNCAFDAVAVRFEYEIDVKFFEKRNPAYSAGSGLLDSWVNWPVEGGELPFDAFSF